MYWGPKITNEIPPLPPPQYADLVPKGLVVGGCWQLEEECLEMNCSGCVSKRINDLWCVSEWVRQWMQPFLHMWAKEILWGVWESTQNPASSDALPTSDINRITADGADSVYLQFVLFPAMHTPNCSLFKLQDDVGASGKCRFWRLLLQLLFCTLH